MILNTGENINNHDKYNDHLDERKFMDSIDKQYDHNQSIINDRIHMTCHDKQFLPSPTKLVTRHGQTTHRYLHCLQYAIEKGNVLVITANMSKTTIRFQRKLS